LKFSTNFFDIYHKHIFFFLKKFQSKGVGREVAHQIWDMHQGIWEVSVIPENKPAHAFWQKIISAYTSGHYVEEIKDVDYDAHQPKRIVFTFDSCLKRFVTPQVPLKN
jgi:predicted acetyltransferase